MPRVLQTPEQREESKRISNERNKKWQKDHKEEFSLYQKQYYSMNKERLDARGLELRRQKALIKKEAKMAENSDV